MTTIETTEAMGRHELKYYINQSDLIQLRSRLSVVLKTDENSPNRSGYRVQSLYFDNYNDKALREKIDGVDDREKFRLRLYNSDVSFIRLEKKSKRNGICYKQSTVISYDACKNIIDGNFTVFEFTSTPLLVELYAKMRFQNLRPRYIVDYMREAFIHPAGNVRVTLDYDIRGSDNIRQFCESEIISVPVPNTAILEVKYDNFLPEIIRGLTALSSRQSSAFSKYAAVRI